MKIRVGFGFDVHQLVAGRELWLGGIRLEHEKGLLGHLPVNIMPSFPAGVYRLLHWR